MINNWKFGKCLLFMLAFTQACYASDGGGYSALVIYTVAIVIIPTLILSFLLRWLTIILKLNIAKWAIYTIAFIVSLALFLLYAYIRNF
jgi:hypothetical protein